MQCIDKRHSLLEKLIDMTIIQAIVLGIIQGLTEFLPISSTAHMTLFGVLSGMYDPQNPESLTAILAIVQIGTLVSVLAYFAKDIINISQAFVRENFRANREKIHKQSENARMGWFVILGTLPIVTIGVIFKKIIEGTLTKDPIVIASSLIIFALVLWWAEAVSKRTRGMKDLTLFDALIVGLAQCVALIPGASRSGTTITAGLFIGLNRETAARFSFLLSIPAVLASGLYEAAKSVNYLSGSEIVSIAIATIVAGAVGYISIAFFLKFLKKRSNIVFVVYRLLLGAAILFSLYNGVFDVIR